MIYLAFAISAFLAIVRAVEFSAVFRQPKLTAGITKDLFLRYSSEGEVLFVNAVLSSSDCAALVQDVSAELTDAEGNQRIALSLHKLGEPANRGNPLHDHYFFSSSPIDLIPVDVPTRRVVKFIADGGALTDAYSQLRSAVFAQVEAAKDSDEGSPSALAAQAAIVAAHTDFVHRSADAIHLRSGDYTLRVRWKFRRAKRFWWQRAPSKSHTLCASAIIKFAPGARETLRGEMHKAGAVEIARIVQTAEQPSAVMPEVEPISVEPERL